MKPVNVVCGVCSTKYLMDGKEYKLMVGDVERHNLPCTDWVIIKCPLHDSHYKIQLRKKIDAVPQETKQKFLDAIHAGKSVGEATKICGLELELTSHILVDNLYYGGINKVAK